MSKTIFVSQGQVTYVGGTVTEATGADISTDPIVMALGPYPPPAKSTGVAPDVDEPGSSSASRVVKLLIDATTPLGSRLWCWAWISDSPEVEPIPLDGPITVA